MTDMPEQPQKKTGNTVLFWVIVNLGLPMLVLATGGIAGGWVIFGSYGIILLTNIPLCWSLSRGRIPAFVVIYLGSVLLGWGLTFLGCLATFRINT